jgi:LPS export ABC transporter protein LptC
VRVVGILLLSAALGTGLWQSLSPSAGKQQTLAAINHALTESYLEAGLRTQFAGDGTLADSLWIGSGIREVGENNSELREIRYEASGENGAQWDITATKGTFLEDTNELVLTQGVEIKETSRDATMSTASMRLMLNGKRARGDQEVLLTGRGSRTVGAGFELDLTTNTAVLRGNVRTDYE